MLIGLYFFGDVGDGVLVMLVVIWEKVNVRGMDIIRKRRKVDIFIMFCVLILFWLMVGFFWMD